MIDVPRVVLDTHVWLDLLHFNDPRCATLARAVEAGAVEAVVDARTRTEFERVLGYRQLALEVPRRLELLNAYDRRALFCDATAPVPALPRCGDTDDQMFLELAAATGARWLVSRDTEVLALAARMRRDGRFVIVTPGDWTLDNDV